MWWVSLCLNLTRLPGVQLFGQTLFFVMLGRCFRIMVTLEPLHQVDYPAVPKVKGPQFWVEDLDRTKILTLSWTTVNSPACWPEHQTIVFFFFFCLSSDLTWLFLGLRPAILQHGITSTMPLTLLGIQPADSCYMFLKKFISC